MSKTCLALLAEGSEELELIAPVDILRRAGFDVTLAGVNGAGCVKGRNDIKITPDVNLSDVASNDYDVIFIPGGGGGVKRFIESDLVKQILVKQENSGRVIAAICAGPTVLKAFSLANNRKVTSYPTTKDEMISGGKYTYVEEKVVIDGNIITSRGAGTAIDFGLAIVQKFLGLQACKKISESIIYE